MAAASELNRIVRNTAALAAGGVTAQILFVWCEALIARHVGAEAYGVFSSVYALTLILCFVIEFGMNWKLVEDGARDTSTLASNLGTMMTMALIVFAIVYPVAAWLLAVFGGDDRASDFYLIFAFFGLSLVFQDLFAGVYAALQRMETTAVFQTAVPGLVLGVMLLLPLRELSLETVAVAFVGGSAVATTLWGWVTCNRIRPVLRLSRTWTIFKGSYLYGLTGLLTNVHLRIGVLVLATFQDAKAVALFAAAHRLITLGFKVPVLLTRVISPKLFADTVHRPEKFKSSVEVLLRFTAAASVVMGVGIFTVSDLVIGLVYGDAFSAAGTLLQILGISLALKTFAQIAQTIITAADDHEYRTRTVGLVTALGTIVAIPLSIKWGPVGAAAAAVLSDFTWSLLMLHRLKVYLPTGMRFQIVAMPLLSAGLAIGLSVLMPPGSLVAVVMCPLVTIGILWLSGYLRPVLAVLPADIRNRIQKRFG